MNEIRLGPYTIRPFPHGGYWVEKDGGEGMQVSEVKLVAWIERFWREEF